MRIPTTSEIKLWYYLITWTILLSLIGLIFIGLYYLFLSLMAPGRYILFLITSNSLYSKFDHINLYVIITNLTIWFIIIYISIKLLRIYYRKKEEEKERIEYELKQKQIFEDKIKQFSHIYQDSYIPKNFNKIKILISKEFNIDAESIKLHSFFNDSNLNLDNNDICEILLCFEKDFDIIFPESLYEDLLYKKELLFRRVSDLVYYLNKEISKKQIREKKYEKT